jgi:hypothetical protein
MMMPLQRMMRVTPLLCWMALGGAACGLAPEQEPVSKKEGAVSFDDLKTGYKKVGEVADTAGSAYSYYKTASDVTKFILQTFDIQSFESDEQIAIDALSSQLNQLGADVIWYIGRLDGSNLLAATMSDLMTSRQVLEQSQYYSWVHFDTTSDAYASSARQVAELEDKDSDVSLHFLRYFRPRLVDPTTPEGVWAGQISAADRADAMPFSIAEDPGSQFVYDWRLGVPRMMLAIAARIHIMAAADPGFTLQTVKDELMLHRDALIRHRDKMLNGVKCARYDSYDPATQTTPYPNGWYYLLCADIYSGTYFNTQFLHGNQTQDRNDCGTCDPNRTFSCSIQNVDKRFQLPDQKCLDQVSQKWAAFYGNMDWAQEELRRKVLDTMPIFEMETLIDDLYYYANPAPDLSELRQQIPEHYGYNCLDVQWNNPVSGTPVWMWPCTGAGNGAQRWHYDRRAGTIRNTSMNKCLDVHVDLGSQVTIQDLSRGAINITLGRLLHIADCNGSDTQRWTYDPSDGRLYSGIGSTMGLRSTDVQDFPYLDRKVDTWGWYFRDSDWRADKVDPCTTSPPLTSDADVCVSNICNVDPFCCTNFWDGICIGEVGSVCGQSCPPPL